jgi:hypothetical protein
MEYELVKFSSDIFFQWLIQILNFFTIFQTTVPEKTIHIQFQIINLFHIDRINPKIHIFYYWIALSHTVDHFRNLHEDFHEITDDVEIFFDFFSLSGQKIVHHPELVLTTIFFILYLDSYLVYKESFVFSIKLL